MSYRRPPNNELPPHKPKCLYEVLGLSKNASVQDIRHAYKALAKKWHPDRCQEREKTELCKQNFQRISEAYAVLVDPKKRQKYDRGELDHNKEPIDVEEFLNELRILMLMHGKKLPENIDPSAFHNVPGTNVPDFNEIRSTIMAHPAVRAQHEQDMLLEQQRAMQANGGVHLQGNVGGHGGVGMAVATDPGCGLGQPQVECDYLGAFMADAVEVLSKNWYRCTLCTGPHVPVVVYPCQKLMRTHFEGEHVCEFLAFVEEYFPEDSGNDACEEFKKMLDGMNVSENDWKACQMIDQSAKQAPPPHRPNGYTHGTHGPGRMPASAQVPYSLSFTDLAAPPHFHSTGKRKALVPQCASDSKRAPAPLSRTVSPPLRQGIDAAPPVPLMQRTFTMQRSMPNPPTESLCPSDWMDQMLQQAGGVGQWDAATSSSSSSSPSSSFFPSPSTHDPGFGGGFPGFTMGGEFGGFPPGGAMGSVGGRPPLSGGGAAKGGKSSGSCLLTRKWKR